MEDSTLESLENLLGETKDPLPVTVDKIQDVRVTESIAVSKIPVEDELI